MEGFQAMEKTPRQRPGDQGRFGSELGLEYVCPPKNLRQMAGSLKTCFPENSLKSLVLFFQTGKYSNPKYYMHKNHENQI